MPHCANGGDHGDPHCAWSRAERPSRSDFLVLFRGVYPGLPSSTTGGHIILFRISSGTLLEACSQMISWLPGLIARCAAFGNAITEILLKLTRGQSYINQITPWSPLQPVNRAPCHLGCNPVSTEHRPRSPWCNSQVGRNVSDLVAICSTAVARGPETCYPRGKAN